MSQRPAQTQQPSSGDLKELQRERRQSASSIEQNNSPDNTQHRRRRSSITISSPTLLQRRRQSALMKDQQQSPPCLVNNTARGNNDTTGTADDDSVMLDDEDMEISPMPTGAKRMAALRDLGATFEEGQKSVAKVATPTGTVVPSFVDSEQLETLLKRKGNPNLKDTCKETVI